jgi:hypothetical protein
MLRRVILSASRAERGASQHQNIEKPVDSHPLTHGWQRQQ